VSQMTDASVGYDLVANLFNPDKLMLQTAAYVIYKLDQEAYHTNTRRLKPSIKKELDKAILPPVYQEEGERYHQNLLLIERVVLLKALPHFANVHGEVITLIADVMEEITVQAGTELIQVGDNGGTPLYIVRTGTVTISKAGEEDEVLEENSVFGEQLVSESESFDFSAVATTDCALLVLRKEELLDIMVQHLDLTESYLKVLNDEIEKDKEEFEEEMMMDII
ncbi:MAG: cyclic nucleotide-binding domain-containing protein, partial [Cytophagales bacterium]|nr:cyclic nucleotide-binding domain-containing protein [Cytophagales bacterium]